MSYIMKDNLDEEGKQKKFQKYMRKYNNIDMNARLGERINSG